MGDFLIQLREGIVGFFSASSSKHVLNEGNLAITEDSSSSMLEELEESLLAIRSIGFSESGQRIEYEMLAQSEAYRKFKGEIAPKLKTFNLKSLESQEKQLAFWINIYNMLTIDGVISRSIRASVTEGWLGISRFFRSAAYQIDDQRYSLEDIEHGILRSNQGNPLLPGPHFASKDPRKQSMLNILDPRIHFALNCASLSCPPIAFYQAEAIDAQLDLASRSFIEQESRLSEDGESLKTSSIFKWYAKDFGGESGMRTWIAEWLQEEDPRRKLLLNNPNAKIQFRQYRWELNK